MPASQGCERVEFFYDSASLERFKRSQTNSRAADANGGLEGRAQSSDPISSAPELSSNFNRFNLLPL